MQNQFNSEIIPEDLPIEELREAVRQLQTKLIEQEYSEPLVWEKLVDIVQKLGGRPGSL